ncbi:unnamed protein product [Allacma fusca]|uniref:Fucosyltransferase n=1 Tax=Allacma fusca TaxID=39272 RepID=A0A8J2P3G8_9HEXA|nr:unnamed protein product [Allacma fusca]
MGVKMYKVIICLVLLFSGIFLFLLFFARNLEEVEMELHNKYVHSVQKISNTKKVILMYNHMNHKHYPILDGYCLDTFGRKSQSRCPYSCLFTDDKTVLEFAHAVVFSSRDLKNNQEDNDLPSSRSTNNNQRWVLLSMESPIRPKQDGITGVVQENDLDLRAFNNTFNWTMSYRHDSDIRKTKLVAWISSDCYLERSGSSFLVAQLQNLIPVDVYGKCGKFQCNQRSSERCLDLKSCYKEIASRYKFFLALENSLCEDYVTETFFYALEFGMVPVVYGKANYSELAVPGSFINVMDFVSVRDLAFYLKHLSTHPDEYKAFFNWRRNYFVTTSFHLDIAWCSLCSKLWEVDAFDSLNNASNALTSVPGRFKNQISISPLKTVGLEELEKWSAATAFISKVCDSPPNFVLNTSSTYTFPVARTKQSSVLTGSQRNEF